MTACFLWPKPEAESLGGSRIGQPVRRKTDSRPMATAYARIGGQNGGLRLPEWDKLGRSRRLTSPMDISDWRKKIDEVDAAVLKLFESARRDGSGNRKAEIRRGNRSASASARAGSDRANAGGQSGAVRRRSDRDNLRDDCESVHTRAGTWPQRKFGSAVERWSSADTSGGKAGRAEYVSEGRKRRGEKQRNEVAPVDKSG